MGVCRGVFCLGRRGMLPASQSLFIGKVLFFVYRWAYLESLEKQMSLEGGLYQVRSVF